MTIRQLKDLRGNLRVIRDKLIDIKQIRDYTIENNYDYVELGNIVNVDTALKMINIIINESETVSNDGDIERIIKAYQTLESTNLVSKKFRQIIKNYINFLIDFQKIRYNECVID